MKTIFTSLSPNAQADDILLSLALLAAPPLWQTGKHIARLEREFQKFLGAAYVFSFDSGRTSLFTILTSLNLEAGSEVLLQAYTCVAVPDPVLWTGLTPVFVDIDGDTLNMSPADLEKKITSRSKVLIIQHTFGFPANIDELMRVAKSRGLFVIEDCAHALGATYNNKPVGSFGDAAFFSFGRDKVISSTFGGIAVIKDKKIADNAKRLYASYKFPKRGWTLKQLLHPILMGLVKLTFNVLGVGRALLYFSKVGHLMVPAVYPQEKTGGRPPSVGHRLTNALAIIAFHQFKKLAIFSAHRQQIAKSYEVGLHKIINQRSLSNTKSIYLRYVIRHSRRDEIIKKAKRQGIFLGDWYTTGVAPAGVDYAKIKYNPALCPNAETAAAESVNLPTDIHISEQDAQRIIKFLHLCHCEGTPAAI